MTRKKTERALCETCEHCFNIRPPQDSGMFFCHHPNQKYIVSCWEKSRKKSSQISYIGDNAAGIPTPRIMSTPYWCPRKVEA